MLQSSTLFLETEKISKLLFKYSIPAIVGLAVVSIYNIVDRIFIGQGVGAIAISGLALTLPLMSLVAAIGTLIGAGASARISIVLGMKDREWAQKILGNSVVMTFILSSILITLSMIWLDEILIAFGGSELTIPYAKEYLQIVIPGSIFTNLTFSFSSIMRASGYPKKSMIAILIGAIANLILDPIFIFGLDMGIKGAAYATVISMFISTLFVIKHFFNKDSSVHFAKNSFKLENRIMLNIFSIGLSPFLMNTVASGVNIILNNLLVKHGGDLAIGAFGIINSYLLLIVMVVLGLSQGMQPISGYNYGAGKLKRVKDVLKLTLICGVLISGTMFLLTESFPRMLVSVFTSDEQLIAMSAEGLRICMIMFPLVSTSIVIANFFMSISMASKSILMTLSRQIIFLIPALYIGAALGGLTGIWIAVSVSDFLSVVVAVVLILQLKRKLYGKKRHGFNKRR